MCDGYTLFELYGIVSGTGEGEFGHRVIYYPAFYLVSAWEYVAGIYFLY